MKARVKGTNNIIDVEFDEDAFNEGYPPYREKENDMFYQPEQLEWVDNEENADPDYWTRLEHQYAGMAMQGLCANAKFMQDHEGDFQCHEEMIAEYAKDIAHALVEMMKESI